MANRIHQLLETWLPQKDELQWVLATIIETQGSSYRKAGAMMMINSLGQYFGLLSGGCLESDIMRQARKCWDSGANRIAQYDMREEEDLAWQLGIGCGGMVKILLQPVTEANDYLQLLGLLESVKRHKTVSYWQKTTESAPENLLIAGSDDENISPQADKQNYFVSEIAPPPHLAVFGGGVDAIPVVTMASQLGWQVTLVDSRTSYARASQFACADTIVKQPLAKLVSADWLQDLDAVVIMMHNIALDAEALKLAVSSATRYIGMLGPGHRTERVLKHAQMTHSDIPQPFANPVGLSLGGELPESIALSVMAEIHAFLEQANGQSISGLLTS